jgi:hypothetical protein
MGRADLLEFMLTKRACHEATEWVEQTPGSPQELWESCPRGDWMLWLAAKAGVDRKQIVLAACTCARLALEHVKPGETRPLAAIEAAEKWARGEEGVTLDQVRKAAAAAYAAAAYAAAADADAADARKQTLAQCASLVRQHIVCVWTAVESALGAAQIPDCLT